MNTRAVIGVVLAVTLVSCGNDQRQHRSGATAGGKEGRSVAVGNQFGLEMVPSRSARQP